MKDPHPKIVYKYRNWHDEFHKDVLFKNHLYLSSPEGFNDPFDCHIPPDFRILDTDEKKEKFTDHLLIKHFQRLVDMGEDIEKLMQYADYNLKKCFKEYTKKQEQLIYKRQNKYYGILSLSRDWNNILLWSHYANKHQGYCVGLYQAKLRESKHFGTGGFVNHPNTEDYPSLNPFEEDEMKEYFIETHTKAKDWAYEDEYRLTRVFFPKIPSDEDRTIKIPNESFAEIILGISCSPGTKKDIIKLGKCKNIPVFQAVKVPYKFKIDREIIK